MAKKDIEEAKVQVQQEVEQVTEGTQERSEQTSKEPAATIIKEAKKVKIHTTEEVDCIIAGIHYVFAKNKDAQVPADVAAILVNAQKAYRQ